MLFSPILGTCLLFLILIMISIKDIREGIIPDIFIGFMVLLGILRFGMTYSLSVAILGILSCGLYKFYPLLKNEEWLGFGDVKMMTASGLWLDVSQIPLFLMLGGGMGIGMAFLWRMLKKGERYPFGPALALSLGICILGGSGLSIGENKMTTTFTAHTLAPPSGNKPDSIVVLIHGYGANGEDLLSLGNAWASLLPNTLFVAPDGPDVSEVNPKGNQWFSLGDWRPAEKFTEIQLARMMKDLQNLTPSLNHYLDNLLKIHNLPSEKLALVGFSQGAMVALHLALHRDSCAGVVAYSGAFLDDPKEIKIGRPPVLLIHGLNDQLLPPFFSQAAEEDLKALHVPVTLSLLPGLEHGIDGRGLGMGGAFLKEQLYKLPQPGLWEHVKKRNN